MAFDHSLHTFRPRRFDKDLHTYKPKYNRHPPGDEDNLIKIQKELTCDSLSFNDISDYIICENDASLKPTLITISIWINILNITAPHCILMLENTYSTNTGYTGFIQYGLLRFDLGDGSDPHGHRTHYNISGQEGKWIHSVVTYDGIIQRLYINGKEKATESWAGIISYNNDKDLYIGCANNMDYSIKASLANVRIYNRAISSSECASLFRGKSISNAGLVLHLPLTSDYSTKTVVKDESGNGNDGTLHGCSWNCHWDRKRIYEEV